MPSVSFTETYNFEIREFEDHVTLFLWDVPLLIAPNREELERIMDEKMNEILSDISPATPVHLLYDGPSEYFKTVEGALIERGFFPYEKSKDVLKITLRKMGDFLRFEISMDTRKKNKSFWLANLKSWEEDFGRFLDENLRTKARKLKKMILFEFEDATIVCDGRKIKSGDHVWVEKDVTCEISADGIHWIRKRMIPKLPAEFLKFKVYKLEITGKPDGAVIKIDGENYGKAPLMTKLIEGIHEIEIERKGYEKFKSAFYIGENTKYEYELKELRKANLALKMNVPADVYVDGVKIAKNIERIEFEIEAGKHEIEVKAPKRRMENIKVELSEGERKELDIELKGIPGKRDWIFELPEDNLNYIPIAPDVLVLYNNKNLIIINARKKKLIGKADIPKDFINISYTSKSLIITMKDKIIFLNPVNLKRRKIGLDGIPVFNQDELIALSNGNIVKFSRKLGKILWKKSMNPLFKMDKVNDELFTLDVFGNLCKTNLRNAKKDCVRFPGYFGFTIFNDSIYIFSSYDILKLNIESLNVLEKWDLNDRIRKVLPCGVDLFVLTNDGIVIIEDKLMRRYNEGQDIIRGKNEVFIFESKDAMIRSCKDDKILRVNFDHGIVDVKEAFGSFYIRLDDSSIVKLFGMDGL